MEEFFGESIEVEKDEALPRPVSFKWRGAVHNIAEVLDEHIDTGYGGLPPQSQNWRTRRHRRYYVIKDSEGDVFKIYLDYANRKKPTWWLVEKWGEKKNVDVEIKEVDVTSDSALKLMRQLDEELAERYPNGPIFGIDVEEFQKAKDFFVLAFADEKAVGCGAFRKVTEQDAEIKRMFVLAYYRGRGISKQILSFLEETARQKGFSRVCLETGIEQPESIGLYVSFGYKEIPPFGQYRGNTVSKCFGKEL